MALPISEGNYIFQDIETVLEQHGKRAPSNTTWFVTKIHSKNYPVGPVNGDASSLRVNRAGMELLGLPWARQPEPIRPQLIAPEVYQSQADMQPAVVNYGGFPGRSPVASPVVHH